MQGCVGGMVHLDEGKVEKVRSETHGGYILCLFLNSVTLEESE